MKINETLFDCKAVLKSKGEETLYYLEGFSAPNTSWFMLVKLVKDKHGFVSRCIIGIKDN
jgi:hypothetical protein